MKAFVSANVPLPGNAKSIAGFYNFVQTVGAYAVGQVVFMLQMITICVRRRFAIQFRRANLLFVCV